MWPIATIENTSSLKSALETKIPIFGLFVVAALWGLTLPLIELCMKMQDPFLFVSLRFTLAAIFVLPYFIRNLTKQALIVGLVLGVTNCGAFVTQTIGLQTVDASRAGFLTGINVLLVPFMAPFFKMGSPGIKDIISTIICFFGIYVLIGCDIGQFTMGDFWVVLCVFFIAFTIVYIAQQAKNGIDPYMLAYSQIVMTAFFAWITCFLFGNFDFSAFKSLEFIYSISACSFLSTILAIILQSKYQKEVSAQQAAIIFSLEPVFAAIFNYPINGAQPTQYLIYGGIIILASILIREILPNKLKIQTS